MKLTYDQSVMQFNSSISECLSGRPNRGRCNSKSFYCVLKTLADWSFEFGSLLIAHRVYKARKTDWVFRNLKPTDFEFQWSIWTIWNIYRSSGSLWILIRTQSIGVSLSHRHHFFLYYVCNVQNLFSNKFFRRRNWALNWALRIPFFQIKLAIQCSAHWKNPKITKIIPEIP